MVITIAEYIEREKAMLIAFKYPFFSDSLMEEIAAIPAADVVEVVRCRDCKHCDPENYHCDHHMGTAAPLRRKPDDFCSYGEKRRDKDGTT